MVDTQRLTEAVNASGLKRYVIAERAGMNKRTLQNKLQGKSDFTASEIQMLTSILHLSRAEREKIFFAQ